MIKKFQSKVPALYMKLECTIDMLPLSDIDTYYIKHFIIFIILFKKGVYTVQFQCILCRVL